MATFFMPFYCFFLPPIPIPPQGGTLAHRLRWEDFFSAEGGVAAVGAVYREFLKGMDGWNFSERLEPSKKIGISDNIGILSKNDDFWGFLTFPDFFGGSFLEI